MSPIQKEDGSPCQQYEDEEIESGPLGAGVCEKGWCVAPKETANTLPVWSREEGEEERVLNRNGHSTTVVGNQLVVFGGRVKPEPGETRIEYINANVTNEVWSKRIGEEDDGSARWVRRRADEGAAVVVTTSTTYGSVPSYYLTSIPFKRERHASATNGTHLYIWGGRAFWWYHPERIPSSGHSPRQSLSIDDLWKLDTRTWTWTVLTPSNPCYYSSCSDRDAPLAATNDDHPAMVYEHPYLVLVGVRKFRVYTYNVETGAWKLRCNHRGTTADMCGNTRQYDASNALTAALHQRVLYSAGEFLMALDLGPLFEADQALTWKVVDSLPSASGFGGKCDFALAQRRDALFLLGGSAWCNPEDVSNERFNHLWSRNLSLGSDGQWALVCPGYGDFVSSRPTVCPGQPEPVALHTATVEGATLHVFGGSLAASEHREMNFLGGTWTLALDLCADAEDRCVSTECRPVRCEPASGACELLPVDLDGAACVLPSAWKNESEADEEAAESGFCYEGLCVANPCLTLECAAADPCVEASCDPLQGGCVAQEKVNGAPCPPSSNVSNSSLWVCVEGYCFDQCEHCERASCYDLICSSRNDPCQYKPTQAGMPCEADGRSGQCNGEGSCWWSEEREETPPPHHASDDDADEVDWMHNQDAGSDSGGKANAPNQADSQPDAVAVESSSSSSISRDLVIGIVIGGLVVCALVGWLGLTWLWMLRRRAPQPDVRLEERPSDEHRAFVAPQGQAASHGQIVIAHPAASAAELRPPPLEPVAQVPVLSASTNLS